MVLKTNLDSVELSYGNTALNIMKKSQFLIGLLLAMNTVAVGQVPNKRGYFGIRMGYVRASTDLTSSQKGSSLIGVDPLNSFYGGAFYQRNLSQRVVYRIELNYQQKGNETQDRNGNVLSRQRFHYVGVTPLIGITPLSGLNLLVGPEANFYFGRTAFDRNAPAAELGISGRVAYRYKWIGIEAGYFRGFNEYNSINIVNAVAGNTRFSFKNRTWQIGLIFVPTMLRTKENAN